MNKSYLLIGGNIGDRLSNLSKACKMIQANAGQILMRSLIYETAAWGIEDQPAFFNQALLVETILSAKQLLKELLNIEELLGRKRAEKFGPRIIDIDILFYNDEIINEEGLTIPHPALHERRFVLVPLAEIAAGYIHPVLKKNMKELLDDCKDNLAVKLYGI